MFQLAAVPGLWQCVCFCEQSCCKQCKKTSSLAIWALTFPPTHHHHENSQSTNCRGAQQFPAACPQDSVKAFVIVPSSDTCLKNTPSSHPNHSQNSRSMVAGLGKPWFVPTEHGSKLTSTCCTGDLFAVLELLPFHQSSMLSCHTLWRAFINFSYTIY